MAKNTQQQDQELYVKADTARDWTLLKGHPRLLWSWQLNHPKDVQAIALYARSIRGKETKEQIRFNLG